MIPEALPDIPRFLTGLAEWSAAFTYVLIARPRGRNRGRYVAVAVLLPLFIAFQVGLGLLPLPLWTFGMITAAFMMFGAIRLLSGLPGKDSGFLAARAFVLAELVQSLHWQLWVHWHSEDAYPELWSGTFFIGLLFLLLVYGAAFTAAFLAERRNFIGRQWIGVDTYGLVMAVAIAALTFVFANLSFVYTETPFSGRTGPDVFYIRTLVGFIGYVALYVQQSRRNQLKATGELAQTRAILQRHHAQYLQSKRTIEDLARMHHDLKHYVQAIRGEESAARRSEYLTELESAVLAFESEIQTGHGPVDIILSTHKARCVNEGISLTTMVDGRALEFMDLMSLFAILGNALDNAIEASLRIPDPDQRIIRIAAYNKRNFTFITIENHWPFSVQFEDGIPQTTKTDRSYHGIGARSIQTIAESYSGSATFSMENDWFTVRVLIPRPAEAS